MKKLLFLLFFLLIATVSHAQNAEVRKSISLAGEWKFRIDSLDQGINNKWYENLADETIKLPGSMTENGKGDEVSLKTPWTGIIQSKSYFTSDRYARYRQPGNFKVPFWLQPVLYYKGVAWYQKEFDIPTGLEGKSLILFLERPHWESTVYVNNKKAGSDNNLSVPHQYDITDLLIKGKNRVSIRIDNREIIPIGRSHGNNDDTQTNWNGIIGDISLKTISKVFISDVAIYPDIKASKAKIIVELTNKTGKSFNGKIVLEAESFNSAVSQKIKGKEVPADAGSKNLQLVIDYPMGNNIQLWNEFTPSLYKLSVSLKGSKGEIIDRTLTDFGMREFKAKGTMFEINGQQTFLRGTSECCTYPLTGYPSTDVKSWEKVLQAMKDCGLNNVRFDSWCPPEAAFIAGDKMGFYFQIECSAWCTVGDGGPVDEWIYQDGDNILKAYGNHPSFCLMAEGDEPGGKNMEKYLGKLLTYWKGKDTRRVYTTAGGWPIIPENDFNLIYGCRIHEDNNGLRNIINDKPPQTLFDFRDFVSKFTVPTLSHETGQWCVYPDFKEIKKYTGALRARNYEIFRDFLTENNMGDQAEDFLMASGKLQALCYKADIEAALRTPGMAGTVLLELHDFQGEGTSPVGVLNVFFEPKGYITPEEYKRFFCETVPLARMQKLIYSNNESFKADIEVAHFGAKPLIKPVFLCRIINQEGEVLKKEIFTKDKIAIGNCFPVSSLSLNLEGISKAQKLKLEVSIENTPYKNSWDFWVYPAKQEIINGNVLITEKLDENAEAALKKGGSVLLLTFGKVGKEKGDKVSISFSPIFWNTAVFKEQKPQTLGILCNPKHPVFSKFPTDYHSDWQWWDPLTHAQVMILDDFPANIRPLIQPIDDWFEARRLALVFEAKTNGGKLMVCSIDLKNISEERLVSKQLMLSILNYMNSESFNPKIEVEMSKINGLITN